MNTSWFHLAPRVFRSINRLAASPCGSSGPDTMGGPTPQNPPNEDRPRTPEGNKNEDTLWKDFDRARGLPFYFDGSLHIVDYVVVKQYFILNFLWWYIMGLHYNTINPRCNDPFAHKMQYSLHNPHNRGWLPPIPSPRPGCSNCPHLHIRYILNLRPLLACHLFPWGVGVPGAVPGLDCPPTLKLIGLVGSNNVPASLASASFCKKLIHNSLILYH